MGPSRLTAGEESGAPGSAAARARRTGGGDAGGRRARARPGAIADRAPSHSLAGLPLGRIAFKTSPSPPRGRAGGGRGAGRGGRTVMCPQSRSAPTFSLRSPNLVPSPTQAPTFPLLVATRPVPQTQPNFPVWVRDSGSSQFFQLRFSLRRAGILIPIAPPNSSWPKSCPCAGIETQEARGREMRGRARCQTQDTLLLWTPSWEGRGLGSLGTCQTRILASSSLTVLSSASGSPTFYPTQLSPAMKTF